MCLAITERNENLMSCHYDFISIGGGSAGYAGARTAREKWENVALVDGARELGGLCILQGCMPSKTLIYSTEVLHLARKAGQFGLDIPNASADMPKLHERKRRVIGEFAAHRQSQLQSGEFDLYRQSARFTGDHEITLDNGTKLTADKFLIATGSHINCPPVPGLSEIPYLTSDDVLELDYLPESVIVLGGGYVGCELAQYLRRLGTRVVQIQRSFRILKDTPSQAARTVENVFRQEGIELFTDTQIEQVEQTDKGVRVTFYHQGAQVTREAATLFNALGRSPNTKQLALESANVECKPSGHVTTNEYQQTSNPDIFAAGDCASPYEIVHVAIMQAECAARYATGRHAEPVDYNSLVKVIFTDPQIAIAGLSEDDVQAQGIEYLSADSPFDDHGKAILMEAKEGYVKILADKEHGRILGAECVGKDASELIHSLAVALPLRATVHDLLKAHWFHPTLSEIWTYPLEDLVAAFERTRLAWR